MQPTPEPVLFAHHFESLFLLAHGDRLTPEVKERLRGIGLDLDKPLLPAYPVEVGRAALHIGAEEFHPELSKEEALREMGRTFMGGWQQTLLGRAAAGLLRVIGPRRTLSQLDRAFRTGDNFTRTRVEDLGRGKVRVHFNEMLGAPSYYAGVLDVGSQISGARNAKVSVERAEGTGGVILLEWEE